MDGRMWQSVFSNTFMGITTLVVELFAPENKFPYNQSFHINSQTKVFWKYQIFLLILWNHLFGKMMFVIIKKVIFNQYQFSWQYFEVASISLDNKMTNIVV